MIKMLEHICWTKPRIIYTSNGTKLLQEAPVPDDFWAIWKIHKEKLKQSGISVKKIGNKWMLQKWTEQKSVEQKEIDFYSDVLRDYQNEHTKILLSDLQYGNVLDASDTGTGKTFCALAIAKHLNLFPIVITPKSVIPSWKKVAKIFKIDLFVSNYEQYRESKTEYCEKIITEIEQKNNKTGKIEKVKDVSFKWSIPENVILIFDEAHRMKNSKTQNSKMLIAAKETAAKILCLSATIADNPLQLYALGLILELFQDAKGFWQWCHKRGVYKGWFGNEFKNTPENLKKIHEDIFPHKGHRIAIKDLGDKFPENLIISEAYEMSSADQIQEIYNKMKEEIAKLKETKKKDKECILTEILRARQEIELLKVPTFVELAEDHIEEGMSIALFVNFEQTIQALSERLKTTCIITGSIKNEEREKNIKEFQEGKQRIILCNSRAGGVGISLHDEYGNYPRISIISPTYSAQDLKQVLGRIHREGSKSKALQKIIFASGTIEEEIAEKVQNKLNNITLINDGDLFI